MERLPFDPSKARGAKRDTAADTAAGENRPLSVSQLSASIDGALREGLPARVSVRGEISGFKNQTHWYFTLKDEHAVIGCVMFASSARRQSVVPGNGDEVIVSGRVEYWSKGGRIQLYADRVEPVGQGRLEREYQRLVTELREKGWFEVARKRELPAFPRRVAVVTSATGAALQDVIDTARRRCPAVELCVVDVRVQGESATPQITRALNWLSQQHDSLGIDAIILTRGGGSLEDLWAFNELAVAEAVFNCAIPVVAAIGHETDTTIAELIADERCATPTQAAMRLLPDSGALRDQTEQFGRRLDARITRVLAEERRHLASLSRLPALRDGHRAIEQQGAILHRLGTALDHATREAISARRHRLFNASDRLQRHRPSAALGSRRQRLDRASYRLEPSIRARVRTTDHLDRFDEVHNTTVRRIERHSDRLAALGRELEVVSPLRILSRGYTVTSDNEGNLLRSAAQASEAKGLLTRFVDGSVASVRGGSPPAASERDGSKPVLPPLIARSAPKSLARRRSRGGRKPESKDQLGLFGADRPLE